MANQASTSRVHRPGTRRLALGAIPCLIVLVLVMFSAAPILGAKPAYAASITLSPTSGPTGTTVSVSGSGGFNNGSVTIYWDYVSNYPYGTQVDTCTYGSGSLSGCSFHVPDGATAGAHTVGARQSSTRYGTATFNVTVSTSLAVSAATGTYGGTTSLSATLTAGGSGVSNKSVSFSLNGSSVGSATTNSSGVATLSSASLAGIAAGTYTTGVSATFAGDTNYLTSSGTASLTISKANQTITVGTHAPSTKVYNGTFTVAATASSSLAVTYGSSGACTNNGDTFTMTSGTGTCTVTYNQAGNGNYNAATPVSESVTAQKASQTITVGTHAPSTKVYNGTFTVAATASSSLAVTYGSSGACTNNSATFTMTSGAGTCTVTYNQAGDGNYNAATQVTESATAAPAALTVTASNRSKNYGETVTFAGTEFTTSGLVNGDSVSSVTLTSAGAAAGATVAGSPYPIVPSAAAGTGLANYTISYANGQLTVTKAATTTGTPTSSSNPSTYGNSVTFTASVSGSGATGTVQFKDGSTVLGTGTLSSGSASFSTSALTAGTHTITAVYVGDANYNSSTSPSGLTQTVNPAATSTTLGSSGSPSVYGQAVTFTANVSPNTASGTVTFKDGSAAIACSGGQALSAGVATCIVSSLAPGSHTVTAVYGSDGNYAGSTSTELTQAVNQAASETTLVSSQNPSVINQAVTYQATVSAVSPGTGIPAGSVAFKEGGTVIGDCAAQALDAAGRATCAVIYAAVGSHTITAEYGGDPNYAGSTSAELAQTVNKIGVTLHVSSSKNASAYGDAVHFTASVTPAEASGSIQFQVDDQDLGSAVALGSGSATSGDIATLAAGNHVVKAIYTDGEIYEPTAATLENGQQVDKAPLKVTADNQAMVYGGALPAFTMQYDGFVNGEGEESAHLTAPICAAQGTTSPLGAGNHDIVCAGGAAANYQFAYVAGTLAVGQAPLAVSVLPAEKLYGDANPAFEVQYSGFIPGEDESVLGGTLAFTTDATAASGVGTYGVSAGGRTSANYAIEYYSNILTVKPATLTVTADNQSTVLGAMLPTLTFQYRATDFRNGDTASVVTQQPVCSTTYVRSHPELGDFPITCSGALAANYTFTYVDGTLSVSLATSSVSLVTGWNLVSFSVVPLDPDTLAKDISVASVLKSVVGDGSATGYVLVYQWDGQSQAWRTYDPAAPSYANSLATLDNSQGFWIEMRAPATLAVRGSLPKATAVSLHDGWNQVGYPSTIVGTLPDILGSVNGFTLVFAYDTSGASPAWKLFDLSRYNDGNPQELKQLTQGWGYWIQVETGEPIGWTVDYAPGD